MANKLDSLQLMLN